MITRKAKYKLIIMKDKHTIKASNWKPWITVRTVKSAANKMKEVNSHQFQTDSRLELSVFKEWSKRTVAIRFPISGSSAITRIAT